MAGQQLTLVARGVLPPASDELKVPEGLSRSQ
jgi:hypothetical protein